MPKVPFSELTIMKQKRMKNEGFKKKENTGLDTETLYGKVKLICSYDGDFAYVEKIDDIIKFLTQTKFEQKFNWFYNIKFDFESIIKYLPLEDLIELYTNKTVLIDCEIYGVVQFFRLTYLDKKFFSIITESNHHFYYYDLYNFLDTSLDKASKKFLNDQKKDDVDSSRLNIDVKYWIEEKKKIREYCIYDALLTKKLADYFWDLLYKHMNYTPKRPFSKGKLSEEYFLSRCYIPTINDFVFCEDIEKKSLGVNVLKYAYNSYFGGRFELIKRGFFDKVYSYDIKSAYPYQMANLIDFNLGEWKETEKIHSNAYEGFYYCEIETKEAYFSPIVYKIHDLNLYPNGKFKQYLIKSEIDFINNNFDNTSIKIIKGYEFYPKELKYPLKDEIEFLYKWKESEKDEDIRYVVKIILNSLYGKTIQTVGDGHRTGKLFNPIYASIITAKTRIKLLDLALQNPSEIIMFSTDGVHTTKPFKVPKSPKLGDFGKDFFGEGVYIMSDVYNVWNETKTKNRLRGFSLTSVKDIDSAGILLRDILNTMDKSTKYSYKVSRPYHLGECLMHTEKRSIADINIWGDSEKSIDVNGDRKRIWDKPFNNGKDCLKENILSLPVVVNE